MFLNDIRENWHEFLNIQLSFIFGFIGIILLSCLITPSAKENTYYIFTNKYEIDKITLNHLESIGCVYKKNGSYFVLIDSQYPKIIQNGIIKHENCHIEQFENHIDMSDNNRIETECYIKSLFP